MRRGMASGAAAPGWAPRAVQLLLLLLLPAVCAAAPESPAAAGLSLHPPYFNLAEAAKIRATATCGESEPGGARPRPELYCKLVGGPTAPGSGHTIQVRYPERARRCGGPGGSLYVRSSTRCEAIGYLPPPSPGALETPGYRERLPTTPAQAGDPRKWARCLESDPVGAPPLPTRRPRRGWVKHAR